MCSFVTFSSYFCCKISKKVTYKIWQKGKSFIIGFGQTIKKFHIENLEVDKDHVHMLIRMHPTETISNIVKRLKSYTTYHLWKYDAENLVNQFWKEKMFWSKSYFVRSVGEVDIDVVKKYIDEQGKTKIPNSRKIHQVMVNH